MDRQMKRSKNAVIKKEELVAAALVEPADIG
jgi:hypothetical protein